MLQRYLILWLAGSSLIAFYWPALAPTAIDPFDTDVNRTVMRWLIVVTMFAIGWMLPRDEVHQVARRWPVVLVGTILQYTSMPLLAYLCGRMWGLQDDHLIGMQNAGLGAFLATQLFPDCQATPIAPAMYTFGCMLTGSLLARIWARRGGADT